jgi:hypothetical protein
MEIIMSATIERNGLVYAETREEILDVVCGLIDEAQRDYIFDRRKHDRHPLAIAVNVTPIEDSRLGTEFDALTHDISAGGLSFVYNARIDKPYLLLRFPDFDQPPLLLEIVRQKQIGPFWMIAGRFRTAV